MTRFPQYARTTDPEVLAVIERNKQADEDHHQKCLAFAKANGVEDGAYYKGGWGGRSLRAIAGTTKPTTGQWKKGPGGYGWAPYVKNPINKEFMSLYVDHYSVPGHPGSLFSPGRIHTPQLFEFEGAAYSGISHQPNELSPSERQPEEGGWEEINASEFYAAMEGYNELHFPKKSEDV